VFRCISAPQRQSGKLAELAAMRRSNFDMTAPVWRKLYGHGILSPNEIRPATPRNPQRFCYCDRIVTWKFFRSGICLE
jgi:hypothetical protein